MKNYQLLERKEININFQTIFSLNDVNKVKDIKTNFVFLWCLKGII